MNLKRPLVYVFAMQIAGIIYLEYKSDFYFIAIILLIAIFFFIKQLINKKINIKGLFILILIIIISLNRFNLEKKYYDNIDNKINNLKVENIQSSIDNSGKISTSGVVLEKGSSSNSYYLIVKNQEWGKIKAYLKNTNAQFKNIEEEIHIGNTINIYGYINQNDMPTNYGEFNSKYYYRSIGISSYFNVNEIEIIDDKKNLFVDSIQQIKNKINKQINLIFEDEKDSGIFKAMISGDKSDLDIELKELFNDSGISHILAISGLHLSILGLLLYNFLRKFLNVRKAGFISSIFIFLYGIFINATATSIRAIAMLFVRFVSFSINRTYDSKNTLAIIGIILVFIHPYLIFSAGFQFSFVAVYALNFYENNKKSGIITLNLFLLPITIFHYFLYPTYSIIINLIVIPLMTFVLCFGLIALGLSFFNIYISLFFSNVVHFILNFYVLLCKIFSLIPHNKILFGRPNKIQIVLYFLILYFVLLFINKKNNNIKINKNINSNNIKKIYSNKFVKLVSSIVLVYISINLLFYQNKYNNTISFLNIGQGDSIVIQNKETTYTIDGGSSSNKQNGKYILSPFFLSKRINTIDISFLTHADSDHTNGIIYLINEEDKIKINNIALPIYAKDNEKYKKIIDSANSKNINILYVSSNKNNYFENENYDTSLIFNKNITNDNFTKSKLNIIYPLDDDLSKKDLNDQSIVIKLNIESIEKDFSFLFTGDISKKVEKILLEKKENQISNINILKVAHHGSKTSSSEEFIEKVAPLYAIISFGNNNYGHPNEEVLKILNENNCEIIKTKEAGEIDFHIQNNEIIINKFIKK